MLMLKAMLLDDVKFTQFFANFLRLYPASTRCLRFPSVAQNQSEFALRPRVEVRICASTAFLRWKSDIPPADFFPVCCSRNAGHERRFVSDLSDSVLRSASRPTSLTGMWSITSMRSIPETSASSPSECY